MIRLFVSLHCLVFIVCLFGEVYSDIQVLISGAVVNETRKACLLCEVVGYSQTEDPGFSWQKMDGPYIKDGGNVRITVDNENNVHRSSLCFDFIDDQSVGRFNCFVKAINLGNRTTIESIPFFKKGYRSQTVVEGQNLNLSCRAWGLPYPEIRWRFLGQGRQTASDLRVLKKAESDVVIVSTLELRKATKRDRGYYWCTASNDKGTQLSQPILVRVKDKLAPLWPFIGFLCELVLIFSIVLVVEIRRIRSEKTCEASAKKAETELQKTQKASARTAKVTPSEQS